jgi:hypothetical protein
MGKKDRIAQRKVTMAIANAMAIWYKNSTQKRKVKTKEV